MEQKPTKGIAIDGSCLSKPGKGSYRAVDIETGKEIFRQDFSCTTNNIMEFCGLVHAIKYRKEKQLTLQIYTDSVTALTWARKRDVVTSLKQDEKSEKMYIFINKCILWLVNNTKADNLPINKWNTAEWGEIPADFGNKQKVAVAGAGIPAKGDNFVIFLNKEDNFIYQKNQDGIVSLYNGLIYREQLNKWIKDQQKQPLVDITILARLKRDFKL
jgi:ribonuclease HI